MREPWSARLRPERVARSARRRTGVFARRLSDTATGRGPAHFLHVGKTGGTAIWTALEPSSKALRAGRYRIHLHSHSTRLRDVPPGEPVFFTLRDPVSRFVSGFNSRLRQGRPRYDRPWNADEAAAFARFPTADSLGRALSSPSPDERAAAEMAIRTITHLAEPQWSWFESPEYFRSREDDVLFVLFQEQLDDDFVVLSRLLGLEGRVRLPGDEVAAHRTPRRFPRSLSDEAVENLQRWYQRDYDLIALCRELRGAGSGGPR